MISFDGDQLIGLFEGLMDNEEKKEQLKYQIKMIEADTKEQLEGFAKDNEIKVATLKKGFKYYKETLKDDEIDDDLYTLMGMVDAGLTDSSEGDDNQE